MTTKEQIVNFLRNHNPHFQPLNGLPTPGIAELIARPTIYDYRRQNSQQSPTILLLLDEYIFENYSIASFEGYLQEEILHVQSRNANLLILLTEDVVQIGFPQLQILQK